MMLDTNVQESVARDLEFDPTPPASVAVAREEEHEDESKLGDASEDDLTATHRSSAPPSSPSTDPLQSTQSTLARSTSTLGATQASPRSPGEVDSGLSGANRHVEPLELDSTVKTDEPRAVVDSRTGEAALTWETSVLEYFFFLFENTLDSMFAYFHSTVPVDDTLLPLSLEVYLYIESVYPKNSSTQNDLANPDLVHIRHKLIFDILNEQASKLKRTHAHSIAKVRELLEDVEKEDQPAKKIALQQRIHAIVASLVDKLRRILHSIVSQAAHVAPESLQVDDLVQRAVVAEVGLPDGLSWTPNQSHFQAVESLLNDI
jgi:hypothetical protein